MKAILFFSVLFLSSVSNAATFTSIWSGVDNPQAGYYSYSDGPASVFGYKDPFIYEDAVDPGDVVNNENYFSVGTGLVDRSMSTGTTFAVENPSLEPINLFFEWRTNDVFDASFSYWGGSINLPSTGMGSFYYTLLDSSELFSVHFAIGGKANSLDSFVEYRFTEVFPTIETPIPASLFLFAPALLGFIGLRKKLS